MKVIIYEARPDEYEAIEKLSKQYGLEVHLESESFNPETASRARGYEAVIIVGNCDASKEALEIIASFGVKVLATRTTGYDRIDVEAARRLGIEVSNVPSYSPNAIAELAVMHALMQYRNVKKMTRKTDNDDYSLKGLKGREIRKSTVGIIGVGHIGKVSAKNFSGLGAKVIGYDIAPTEEMSRVLELKSLEEVLSESDIITLHVPLNELSENMINKETLKLVKPTTILINTSRGQAVNAEDVLEALEEGILAGFSMDVYQNEIGLLHIDRSKDGIQDNLFNKLRAREDVIVTPHYAFYTDEAVTNMIETAFKNVANFEKTRKVINSVLD